MRPYLWLAVLAGFVFLAGVAVIRLGPRLSGPALADAASWTGVAVNVITLLVGLFSLLVAGAAYHDAQQSGKEQQRILSEQKLVLDKSTAALTSVVGQLEEQRRLFDKTLETSTKHLELSERVYEEETRRLARRPVATIGIEGLTAEQQDRQIQVLVDVDGWGVIPFVVTNTGEIDLVDPIATFFAPPGFFCRSCGS